MSDVEFGGRQSVGRRRTAVRSWKSVLGGRVRGFARTGKRGGSLSGVVWLRWWELEYTTPKVLRRLAALRWVTGAGWCLLDQDKQVMMGGGACGGGKLGAVSVVSVGVCLSARQIVLSGLQWANVVPDVKPGGYL